MPELRVVTGYGKSFIHDLLQDVITIGRSKGNDIALFDHTVSRRHAKLGKIPDGYLLTDLDSRNGTSVNGSRITSRILKHHDLVEIGTSTLTFLDETADSIDLQDREKPPVTELKVRVEPELFKTLPIKEDEAGQEVLASIKSQAMIIEDRELLHEVELEDKETSKISLVTLERSNKILHVLYQISRQLNRTTDFDELLKAIMDLIFQVIDADYGFVVLLGDKPGEIIPKVVKYRTAPESSPQELRLSHTIMDKVIKEKVSVLTSNALGDTRFGGAESISNENIRSVMSVPLWRKDEVIGMIQVSSFRLSNEFGKPDLDLLTTISNQMAMVTEQANLMEKIHHEEMMRSRLERFHSPEIVDLIISGDSEGEDTMLSPKGKTVTVLFTDIENFTPLSERLSPTEVSQLLNRYFRKMTDIIFDYSGTLDKYIGDAIMAVFGAPIERENDAERAILSALDMRNALFQMMKNIEPHKRFDIRLGINSGQVLAGNLGSPKRMDYTVIGDVVNTASRLESIAQPNQILIGKSTYKCVKNKFNIRKIGKRLVKGKSHALTVYEVLDY